MQGVKMKVLIVDDQYVSIKKIQKIMEGFCECEAVDNGQAAVDAYKKAWEDSAPYDLITLDISMPGMDGTEVLSTIRELEKEKNIPKEKRVKILMVTASSDTDTVITCIRAGCDDYLVKPINREIISKKLEQFGLTVSEGSEEEETVRKMIETTVESFKAGKLDLPSMPQVVQEIQNIMNKPTSGVAELTQVIEKDASISVKLITTANSPVYRGVDKIQSVSMAISRIGLKECQNIVSAIANKDLYETKNKQFKKLMDKLWEHSLASAHGAKIISKKVSPKDVEKAFMSGLVHDIGSVLLLKSLGEIVSPKTTFDEADLINSIYEVHTSFGATLLDEWEFSQDFVKIAKLHEWTKFDPETEKNVLIANLADNLAHKIGYGFFDKGEIDLPGLDSIKLLEIDPDVLDKIGEEVKTLMEESIGVF